VVQGDKSLKLCKEINFYNDTLDLFGLNAHITAERQLYGQPGPGRKKGNDMARATIDKPKSVGRPPSGRSTLRAAATRASAKATVSALPSNKEELRARVEKLERANATLRAKNKELRLVSVEAAEQVDALTLQLAGIERRAVRQGRHEAPAETVATREITRPARGAKRKARSPKAADGSKDRPSQGETASDWASIDHAEA
jgi:hypothetical protein